MPNRGQTQDQDKRGRNPGGFSPDDDETAQNEDNQRQAQEQQGGRRKDEPSPGTPEIDSEDAAQGQDDEEDMDGKSTE